MKYSSDILQKRCSMEKINTIRLSDKWQPFCINKFINGLRLI